MQTIKRVVRPTGGSFAIVTSTLLLACTTTFGQISPGPTPTNPPTIIPVVTIQATDPLAAWSGDTGTFTVFRSAGDPSVALNVYYRILGTATNGVDYKTIGNWVQLGAGVYSNTVVIQPIDLGQTNIRTATLMLAPSPLMTPVNYMIGSPDTATVFITPPGVTNLPPLVRLISPPNGSVFVAPANVLLAADARDFDGYVSTVEFFADAISLGARTNNPLGAGPANPFVLVWSNAPVGTHILTALATDNDGASNVSPPIKIAVLPAPPVTNYPPVVRIISPANGSIFHGPLDLPLFAWAADRDGLVTGVEFFTNGVDLGPGHLLCSPPMPGGPTPMICSSNLFTLVWSNAAPGDYLLTAVATDNGGASTVSFPVKIGILPPPPPPTNRPPIVSIVTLDPIAIEGTNCWPWLGLANVTPSWTNWTATGAACRFFTNCGPKNALFAVRRFGDTNDALTVTYQIGGTATNGVDYVALLGVVTIPAGERRALIPLVPLDDGPPDINSTVVLKLNVSSNTPPDYLLGYPRAAAALIIDSAWPRPVTAMLPDKCFHLSATGPDGAWFQVQFSSDLLNWNSVCTAQVINGAIDFVDPDAQSEQVRFYRAMPQTGPPAE